MPLYMSHIANMTF